MTAKNFSIPLLFKKRECSVPTVFGWVALSAPVFAVLCLFFLTIHPFLAVNRPLGGGALIIEGWVPDYCFDSAAVLLKNGTYQKTFITGGPLESGSYLIAYNTYADLGARTLRCSTVPDSLIVAVPAPHSRVDRTWGSACALRDWLDSTGSPITTFDLLSQSTHTRRSRLFFRRALGSTCRIGSRAIADPDYNPKRWWTSSKGVRQTIDESIAYLYALVFMFRH
jgi:uncharacterized SAM-binding protein YcdF (DUF218 family)